MGVANDGAIGGVACSSWCCLLFITKLNKSFMSLFFFFHTSSNISTLALLHHSHSSLMNLKFQIHNVSCMSSFYHFFSMNSLYPVAYNFAFVV